MNKNNHLQQISRKAQLHEQLLVTSTAMLSGWSLPDVLKTILAGVQSIGLDRVRLYLLSEDGKMLSAKAHINMGQDFTGLQLPVESDVYIQEIFEGVCPRIFNRENSQPWPYEEALAKEGVDEWVGVPLLLHDKIIGMLAADNKFSHRPILEEEVEPLSIFAAHAAAAVENARLYKEEQIARKDAEWWARKLQAIQQVAMTLNSEMELSKILSLTCKAAFELFDVDHSGLVLFGSDLDGGRVEAEYPDLGTKGVQIPLIGTPAEEQLIATRAPVVIPDVNVHQGLGSLIDIFHHFDIRSILIVPVMGKGQMLGSFSLDAIGRSRDFTAEEIELCQMFAAYVAVAVENARLFTETKQRARQFETLGRATLAITSPLDRDFLLKTIIQKAVELLSARQGGLYEYDPGRGELTLIATYQGPETLLGKKLKAGEGMAGRLVKSDEPFMIIDNYKDWDGKAPGYDDQISFDAVIEVPLKWQDQVTRVLYVEDAPGRQFTPEEGRLLRLFADHATVTLINAELIDKDLAKFRRLERLSSASNEIIAQLGNVTLDNLLNLIAQKATEILRAEACGIFLVKEPDFLSLEASFGHQPGKFKKGTTYPICSGE
ncbi:MAG: GAF domain-containing protein, partial [Candidatus Promineifilaceae bacterium]